MNVSEYSLQKMEAFLNEIAQRFPKTDMPTVFTDIHIRAALTSGELTATDDDDRFLARVSLDEWATENGDDADKQIASVLRNFIHEHHALVDEMGVLKPFNFVLEDEEGETIHELYVSDDDTVILGGDLMTDLDAELDQFLKQLMES